MSEITSLHLSIDLVDILKKMSTESNLAKTLLQKEICSSILVDDHANYLGLSSNDKTRISYLNKERELKILSKDLNVWDCTNMRYQAKPGAFLSKIFKQDFLNNKEVEKFANLFKTYTLQSLFKFDVVDGKDIKHWYDGENYASSNGSLGSSCMKYDNCQEFFNIYKKNKTVISMLILLDNDRRLVGRSLLWNANDDIKVMDRIYTIDDDQYTTLFKNWAIENNYIYRVHQNWANSLNFFKDNEKKEVKLEIQLSNYDHEYYPYLDTFKWLNKNTGVLTNYKPDSGFDKNLLRVLSSADGSTNNFDQLVLDEIERKYINRHDAIYLENENIYTGYESVNYSNILNKYILRTDSLYLDIIDDYVYLESDRNPSEVSERINEVTEQINKHKQNYEKIDTNISLEYLNTNTIWIPSRNVVEFTDLPESFQLTDLRNEQEVPPVYEPNDD